MSPEVEGLHSSLLEFHAISRKKATDDAAPPPAKRQKTQLMDMKELANFLRQEYNLLTELPTHVRDSIVVTPEAISLYAYYLRKLIERDYRMTRNDFFVTRLPVYLPAIAQLRSLPDDSGAGIAHALKLIHYAASRHYDKLASFSGRWTTPGPMAIMAFRVLDEAMLALSLDLWDREPERWGPSSPSSSSSGSSSGSSVRASVRDSDGASQMRDLIQCITDRKRSRTNPDFSRKYLHRTSQFLSEMRATATARMLAGHVVGARLPPELVGEVERQIMVAWEMPYLPTGEAVRKLWVPRPVLPVCPVDWKMCSRTCPNIMEVDWITEERKFVFYHQGRQRCRLEVCRGHHDFYPDDPYDSNFLLYRTNVGGGFFAD